MSGIIPSSYSSPDICDQWFTEWAYTLIANIHQCGYTRRLTYYTYTIIQSETEYSRSPAYSGTHIYRTYMHMIVTHTRTYRAAKQTNWYSIAAQRLKFRFNGDNWGKKMVLQSFYEIILLDHTIEMRKKIDQTKSQPT